MGKGRLFFFDQYQKGPSEPTQILYLSLKNEEQIAKAVEARRLQDDLNQLDTLNDKIARIIYIKIICALIALALSLIYALLITFLGFDGLPKSIHVIFWAIIFYYAGSLIVKDELWYMWPVWFGTFCISSAILYYTLAG
jgi:uncharacterized membrane protein